MSDKKFNNHIDLQGHEIKSALLEKLAAAPGAPVEGLMYYDTVLKKPFIYNGTAFIYWGVNLMSEIPDANFSGFVAGTDKQYLIWDTGTSKWIPNTIYLNIQDCQNVNYPAPPTAGQALLWNNGTAKWEPTTLPSASGGVNVNNPAVDRFMLSGSGAATNLEAQATITWNVANELMTVGAVAISKPIYHTIEVKDDVGAARAAGTIVGQYGVGNYQYSGLQPVGGIRVTAAENMAPTLPTGNGTVIEFLSTAIGGTFGTSQMHISGTGCIVINPSAYSDDHPNADLYIKGGFASITREVINADVTLDSAGHDKLVSLYVTDTLPHAVILPEPSAAYAGREAEIFVFATNGETITLQSALVSPLIWAGGGAQSGVITTANGRSWRVICVLINSVDYWMVNENS